jgi:hypothetical protein
MKQLFLFGRCEHFNQAIEEVLLQVLSEYVRGPKYPLPLDPLYGAKTAMVFLQ